MKKEGGNNVIIMAGMIGIGKTTYTKAIAEHFSSTAFYEKVEGNPVLEDFYADPKRHAFHLQIFFLSSRFHQIKRALQHQNNVLDRSIFEDALFCRIQHEVYGNISKTEYETYLSLLDNMMEDLEGLPKKSPDLMVYLRGDFDTVISRIKKRGRSFEQAEKDSSLYNYYKELHSRYDTWASEYNSSPMITLQAEDFDLDSEDSKQKMLRIVEEKLKEIRG